jgi:hypothetical protein
MFRALFAHPREVLKKRRLIYCLRISVGFGTVAVAVAVAVVTMPQPTDIIHTHYTECRLWLPPEDEQVLLETCRGL